MRIICRRFAIVAQARLMDDSPSNEWSSISRQVFPTSMLGPAEFRGLVGGRGSGIGATAMRSLLRAGEVPYTLAVAWRNRRYDNGRASIQRVGVPVISIGNLTLGGTGKTPMVKWLARWWRQRNVRLAIVG